MDFWRFYTAFLRINFRLYEYTLNGFFCYVSEPLISVQIKQILEVS